ncbi:hypothetical protein [Caulobacter sp. SSI4214]|uniref:hypothetical protein n=1 Tax=Caulobacter sp. SSI4214 TaxID=2575739 RepID=UPI00143B28B7|nr:hypothetical protein [Caulobacter sp. SSI4214]
MTAIEAGRRPAANVGRRFYLIMSLLMAAVFIGGFGQTVPDDFAPPGLPLLFHIHGAVFTCWVLVFVAQPAFVARGSIKLHRQVGLAGAALAGLMVVMGLAATISAFPAHRVPAFFPPTIFLVMNVLGILTFGGLVAGGIALRRKAEWHKRLMLCATVSILGPGLGRLLPMGSFGAAAPAVMFAVILAFALAGPVADLIVRKRVHPAYAWGVGAIVLSTVLIPPLAFTPQAAALVSLLRGL